MKKAPDLTDIHAAELRLVAAKARTVDGGHRIWLATRSALARPSTLAVVSAAGFCGGLLVGRARKTQEPLGAGEKPTGTESFASVVLALALRSAARFLPVIVSRLWAEHRRDEPCTVVKTTVIHDQDGAIHAS